MRYLAAFCALQDIDTGEILMQAFSDRAAISETMQTGMATFYSRSRKVHIVFLQVVIHPLLGCLRLVIWLENDLLPKS